MTCPSEQSTGQPHTGIEGTTRFWTEHRAMFGESITSTFPHVTEAGDTVVLEWDAEGNLSTGRPVPYSGVGIVATRRDRIIRFRTYDDSAAFLTDTS